jgi:hypothetical protein
MNITSADSDRAAFRTTFAAFVAFGGSTLDCIGAIGA